MRLALGLGPSIAAISLVFAITTIDSRTAHAQNAAAEALFTDGERLIKEGKIAEYRVNMKVTFVLEE